MEKAFPIFLSDTITPYDLKLLIFWLKNDHITRFLNEKAEEIDSVKDLLRGFDACFFTYRFNRNGRFFMLRNKETPIGFIKLARTSLDGVYEIVIVIGDEENWGLGYGGEAVKKCLNMVFFEWRAKKIVANIHKNNHRSIKLFIKAGFIEKAIREHTFLYELTFEEYLKN